MIKFIKYFLILIVMIWGVIWLAYPSYTWHQKITLEIKTPQGLVSGSSVTRVKYQSNIQFFGMGPVRSINTRGEVPVVDLGSGKYIFALIFQEEWFPIKAFRSVFVDKNDLKASSIYNYSGSAFEIANKFKPLLITFDDMNDLKTARKVDPENLSATFGEGYALNSITLEITNSPITEGKVDSLLGLINKVGNNKHLDGDRYHRATAKHKVANSLSILNFIRGQ